MDLTSALYLILFVAVVIGIGVAISRYVLPQIFSAGGIRIANIVLWVVVLIILAYRLLPLAGVPVT